MSFDYLIPKRIEETKKETEIEKLAREYSTKGVQLESLLKEAIFRGSVRTIFLAATLQLESINVSIFWNQGKKNSNTVEG